ncbi:hypothetical protein HZS_6049 [Henneguya salminicola]|nr:hypothetical protein HZS_6049 [Henneguya salminicola]
MANTFLRVWRKHLKKIVLDQLTNLTVNHLVEFVVSTTCACTKTIQKTWKDSKIKISPRNRTKSFNENGLSMPDAWGILLANFNGGEETRRI